MIVSWPSTIPQRTAVSNIVQWIDLTATILDASRCTPDAGVQGQSLLPLMSGQEKAFRSWALSEYRYGGFVTDPLIMTTMLRHENWKLVIWHGQPACGNERDGELYDLSVDPDELQNLFNLPEYASQRRLMKQLLLDAMCETEDRTVQKTRPS